MNQRDQFNVKCGDLTPDLDNRGNKEAREAIQGMANFSNYAINGLGLLFFKNNPVCCKPADNILLLLAHEWI